MARLRGDLAPGAETVFFDLVFDPADAAQVDWGEALIDFNGEPVKSQIFCMRLAYSGACYVQLFPINAKRPFSRRISTRSGFLGSSPSG